MKRLFARLIRHSAGGIHRPGVDQVAVDSLPNDELYRLEHEHRPNNPHDVAVTYFHGSLAAAFRQEPARVPVVVDRPGAALVTDYARARHGEGLFGMESIIPEGETE